MSPADHHGYQAHRWCVYMPSCKTHIQRLRGLGTLSSMCDVSIKGCPVREGSGNSADEEMERENLPESMIRKNTKKPGPANHSMTDAHRNSWRLKQHVQGLHRSTRDSILEWSEVDTCPTSTTKASSN